MPQSLHHVILHIVFSTKNQQEFLDPIIRPYLYTYLINLLEEQGGFAHTIGGTADHVHLLCLLPRGTDRSEAIAQIKDFSKKWMRIQGYTNFAWQKGYGVTSVNKAHLEQCITEIERQQETHFEICFKEEFTQFTRVNHLKPDEVKTATRKLSRICL